ncbi:MAG: glycosyl transferase [Acidobacteria bacterium]|nr:MAG: glycosyl transferase [Acidobacteriota bacterium]PYX44990.1 MAG: glycosyl transferase [Acidobacteriota bacterium]
MRIAQVAPLYESVPPKLYGGTERIVSYLTEELVKRGHDVTLFASGDSLTQAKLVPVCPRALRLDPKCVDQLAHHVLMLDKVVAQRHQFDMIHFHIDYLHFPSSRALEWTTLTTLHGRLDIPDLLPLYRAFRHMSVSSISNAQRAPLPWLNWQGTIYHGLPENQYEFSPKPSGYLVFLGRTSPEKGLDQAVAIARRAGMPLKVGAKVDAADRKYFETCLKPLMKGPGVEFLGEVGFPEKNELLGGAAALLFPITWPEPFGIVMIEAMACGTPVIAYPAGSVPEVVEEGVTGFIVPNADAAVKAIHKIESFDRAACRRRFEERFTASLMSSQYLRLYETLVGSQGEPIPDSSGVPIG